MLPSLIRVNISGVHIAANLSFFVRLGLCSGLADWLLLVVSPFVVVYLWFKGSKVVWSARVFIKVSRCYPLVTWKCSRFFAFKLSDHTCLLHVLLVYAISIM